MKNPSEQNIRDIEIILFEQIAEVKKDPRRVPQAKEIINACGKIINAQKASLDYMHRKDRKLILPVMERQ